MQKKYKNKINYKKKNKKKLKNLQKKTNDDILINIYY